MKALTEKLSFLIGEGRVISILKQQSKSICSVTFKCYFHLSIFQSSVPSRGIHFITRNLFINVSLLHGNLPYWHTVIQKAVNTNRNHIVIFVFVGLDIVVRTGTHCGLDCPGIESRCGREFFAPI